ncbi:MAG: hypothetical protein ACYTFY_13155 [Planctomycetota bacterium]|jgi:hypothetical protein
MKKSYPNILTLSGCSRNVGKTFFACNLISKFSSKKVIAVKITPHFHVLEDDEKVIYDLPQCKIIEESNVDRNKDSSRMLAAGAAKVYYIQIHDSKLPLVDDLIFSRIPHNVPVVCETGGGGGVVPGVSLFITFDMKKKPAHNCVSEKVKSENGTPVFDLDRITFDENSWHLK